jgi:hypothetical protein
LPGPPRPARRQPKPGSQTTSTSQPCWPGARRGGLGWSMRGRSGDTWAHQFEHRVVTRLSAESTLYSLMSAEGHICLMPRWPRSRNQRHLPRVPRPVANS